MIELGDLIRMSRKFLPLYSKAKAAKIVRELVDNFLDMKSSTGIEVLSVVLEYFSSRVNITHKLLQGWVRMLSAVASFVNQTGSHLLDTRGCL